MRTLSLNSLFQSRLFIDVSIVGLDGNSYQFDCIVDTGCVNTLIDEEIIEVLDYADLNFSQPIRIAGIAVSSRAIVLKQVDFAGLKIDNMLVFAAPLSATPVKKRMLLGLNTLNNWNYKVKRTENVIEFSESQTLPAGANSKNRYINYFNKTGNYVLIEDKDLHNN